MVIHNTSLEPQPSLYLPRQKKSQIPQLQFREFLGPGYFIVYDQLLTFTLDTLAPSLTLFMLNILIYRHLRAFRFVLRPYVL